MKAMLKAKKRTSQLNRVYCAFCRLPRTSYLKKHVNWTNVAQSLLVAVLLMYLVWQQFEARVVIFFILSLSLGEIFLQIRWRLTVVCPHCGFDPVLYVHSPDKAAQRVMKKLEDKKESGDFLLKTNNPFQSLPKRKLDRLKKPGEYLSKQI